MSNPTVVSSDSAYAVSPTKTGLTKREYIASMALQTLVNGLTDVKNMELACQNAVSLADCLIRELNR